MTVFAVLAHGDPSTFRVTAEILSPSQIVVHVDSKSDSRGYPQADNISYVAHREDVRWGGFSAVRATESLYELALSRCERDNEYIVLLSGECVPIRPMEVLEARFLRTPAFIYCRGGLLLDGNERNERRILKKWYFDLFDARKTGWRGRASAAARLTARSLHPPTRKRKFSGLNIVAGSQWTALPAGVVREMMGNTQLRDRLTRLLRQSLAPDEIYFHSLIHSMRWSEEYVVPRIGPKGDLRTADFANLHHIDRSLTKYFKAEDLRSLKHDETFFTRKVRSNDAEALRRVLRQLAEQRGPE